MMKISFVQARLFSLFVLLSVLGVTKVAQAGSNEEGLKFLAENKLMEGVVTLPSGLQYKVLNDGSGKYHPGIGTSCSCHYEGKLLDKTVFDSSYERGSPASFAPNQVIKGWTEAMQLMVQGDKWELYIPSELAYGDSGSPPKIPGGSVLIFQMEILDMSGDPSEFTVAVKCQVDTLDKCNEKEKDYIAKIKDWDDAKKKTEIKRLANMWMKRRTMKAELGFWIISRLKLLRQFVPDDETTSSGDGEEEL